MIKCKNCDHVISDDANFCPVCGSRLEIDAKARESETAEHEGRRPVIDPNLASRSLGFGIAGFAVAFFLWHITIWHIAIFCVLAGVFSFLAIFFGIKSMKIQSSRRTDWGMIFGVVTAFLSVIFLAYHINYTAKLFNSARKYSEKLGIEIPSDLPQEYYQHSNVFKMYDFQTNAYSYHLNDDDAEVFLGKIENDPRRQLLPLTSSEMQYLTEITTEEFIIYSPSGYYLCYDLKNNRYDLPSGAEEYHFILLIYDQTEKRIYVYEIWN